VMGTALEGIEECSDKFDGLRGTVGDVGENKRGDEGRLVGLFCPLPLALIIPSNDNGVGCIAANEPRRMPGLLPPVCVGMTGNWRAAREGEGALSSMEENELDAAKGGGKEGNGGRFV
jgi:hypothetical protein